METMVVGIVKNGHIVPNIPLPEGARVQIQILEAVPDISPELQAEFDGWDRASAEALDLVERMAQEMESNEKR